METTERERIKELTKIVRNLMSFIVTDGKNCIENAEQRQAYISKYLLLFTKVMNKSCDPQDPKSIIKLISSDVDWLKNENFT